MGTLLATCMDLTAFDVYGTYGRARHLYAVACKHSVIFCASWDSELVYEADKYSNQLKMFGTLRYLRY